MTLDDFLTQLGYSLDEIRQNWRYILRDSIGWIVILSTSVAFCVLLGWLLSTVKQAVA